MQFNEENKVIIESMNELEARAFIKFLMSEIARHHLDIDNARDLIYDVLRKFKLDAISEE